MAQQVAGVTGFDHFAMAHDHDVIGQIGHHGQDHG